MSDKPIGMPIPLGQIETGPEAALALPTQQPDGPDEEMLEHIAQIADAMILGPVKIALAACLATAAFTVNPYFLMSGYKLAEAGDQQVA